MRQLQTALTVAATCTLATPAYAYLDPGTGSIILQAIIGAIALGAAYLSIFWSRVRSFFSFSSRTKDSTPTATEKDAGKNS